MSLASLQSCVCIVSRTALKPRVLVYLNIVSRKALKPRVLGYLSIYELVYELEQLNQRVGVRVLKIAFLRLMAFISRVFFGIPWHSLAFLGKEWHYGKFCPTKWILHSFVITDGARWGKIEQDGKFGPTKWPGFGNYVLGNKCKQRIFICAFGRTLS